MYNQDFRFEDGIVYFHLSGQYTNKELHTRRNAFQPLIDACAEHSSKKAMIDARELQVEMGTFEMFKAGVDIAFVTIKGIRVAIVAREDMIDPFFEDVAANRGGIVGIFTKMDAARQWLTRC